MLHISKSVVKSKGGELRWRRNSAPIYQEREEPVVHVVLGLLMPLVQHVFNFYASAVRERITLFAQVAQVVRHLPIAVHRTALQPGLLDMPEQTPVFHDPITFRVRTPRVEAAGMNRHHFAEPPD
jgi:hypothetical protein